MQGMTVASALITGAIGGAFVGGVVGYCVRVVQYEIRRASRQWGRGWRGLVLLGQAAAVIVVVVAVAAAVVTSAVTS